MVQTLVASVGRLGGINRPSDVKVVQELLNRVPSAAGGPYPLLAVDSVCGPRTVDAIQKFQVKQLGWGLADGRVDPSGPTLQKLNELTGTGGPPQPKALTSSSTMLCPHGALVRVLVTGTPRPAPNGALLLRATDEFSIVGCPHVHAPCVRVEWVLASDPLNETNVGVCFGARGAALGKVRIVAP